MANPIKLLGLGISYVGLGAVFAMAVIGTISIDLVILAYIAKESRSNSSNIFLSLLLWNFMFKQDSAYANFGLSLLISPFLSAISVGLAVALGVPEIAVLLIAGWAGAFTIILAGAVIYGLGDVLESTWDSVSTSLQSSRNATPSTTYKHQTRMPFAEVNHPAPPTGKGPKYDNPPTYEQATQHGTWGTQTHFDPPIQARASAPCAEDKSHTQENFVPSFYK